MAEDEQKSLDLTSEKESIGSSEVSIQVKPYDPRPQEDTARRSIAYILVGLLGFILIWALASITFFPSSAERIISVLQVILGPIIALVSAATGFYFGSKSGH